MGINRLDELDAFGQLVRIVEYNGGSSYTTRYAYNVRGDLTSVTDAANNVSIMQYDLLSRKTQMTDPDMGTWYYKYDGVGNLIAQIDARDTAINSYYDGLNRLRGKTYSTNVSNPSSYVRPGDPGYGGYTIKYYYDEAGYGSSKGRLTRVIDEAGSLTQSYDVRGRLTSETRTITGAPNPFTQSYSYDAADRIRTTTYPNNEVVTTRLQRAGLASIADQSVGKLR